jgi:hypothetical protein
LSDHQPNLRRFLRAVHRRLVLLRIAESAGWGVLAGAVLGLLLLAVAAYQAGTGHLQIIYLLPLGAGAGAIWSILRQPKPVDSATMADEQLQLADLLSTAYHIDTYTRQGGDGFPAAVLAMAEARCAELSPSSVVLHRLGVRGWSGIGLAAALVIAMGLISANPVESQASYDLASLPAADGSGSILPPAQPGASSALVAAGAKPARSAVRDFPNQEDDGFNSARNTSREVLAGGAKPGQKTDTANPNGAGAGVGTSRSANSTARLTASGGTSSRSDNSGSAAAGLASSDKGDAAGSSSAGGKATGDNPTMRPVPVWATSAWPAARSAAAAALRGNHIPPEYRDLVREYFNR